LRGVCDPGGHHGLQYGARKKASPKLHNVVQLIVDQFIVYDYDKGSASHYADVRTELEQRGEIIGANDLLIAAML